MAIKSTIAVAGLALAALVALPAAASASPALVTKLATDACSAEKSKLGKKNFAKKYGAKKPVRACVKRAKPQARESVAEATTECVEELNEYGAEEFYFEWETFSACVADYAAWINEGGTFEEDTSEDEEDEGLL